MSQANNNSTTPVLINFAGRLEKARERRKREADWEFADLASRLPGAVMLAICKAVGTDSEEPLKTLPPEWRQRAIHAFRASKRARAPAKVLRIAR
jgi:hypothetical protein